MKISMKESQVFTDGQFEILVTTIENQYEVYLQLKDWGSFEYEIGFTAETKQEAKEIIENNLNEWKLQIYEKFYKEEFMED